MDCVMWVLFRDPCPFLKNNFLKDSSSNPKILQSCTGGIRKDLEERFDMELRLHLNLIQNQLAHSKTQTLDGFRSWLKKWYHHPLCDRLRTWTAFYSSDINESHEFLQFLFSCKGMNGISSYGAVVKETIFYGKPWVKIRQRKDKKASLIWNVSLNQLSKNILIRTETNELEQVWNQKKMHQIKTQLKLEEFGDFLVIHIDRLETGEFNQSPISIPFQLEDKKGKKVSLREIIVFEGDEENGHYTAFAKKSEKQWFFYDDQNLPTKILDKLPLKLIKENGVLFFFHLSS